MLIIASRKKRKTRLQARGKEYMCASRLIDEKLHNHHDVCSPSCLLLQLDIEIFFQLENKTYMCQPEQSWFNSCLMASKCGISVMWAFRRSLQSMFNQRALIAFKFLLMLSRSSDCSQYYSWVPFMVLQHGTVHVLQL